MQTPIPSNLPDIERMIRDGVQEDIHLDYKASKAIQPNTRDEIRKDVSAFANSDGGVLIYGVEEQGHLPSRIDDGVNDTVTSREWIENVIASGISPRLDDVRITPIIVSEGRSLYVVTVAKSFRGPHQSADHKYYKRHNFKSEPMEDYEIRDIRNRRKYFPPLLKFEVFDWRRFVAAFDVANVGDVVAEDVAFEFNPPIPWPKDRGMPILFEKGIRKFPPNQRFRFLYFSFPQILSGSQGVPDEFSVKITYFHPECQTRMTDEWYVNFRAYEHSMAVRPEMEEHAKDLVEGIKNLTDQVVKLHSTLEAFKPIVGSTGLDLSIPALKNLRRVLGQGNDPERIHPEGCDPAVFREVLGVGFEMAMCIYNKIGYRYNPESLKDVPGMTAELLERISRSFILAPEDSSDQHGQ